MRFATKAIRVGQDPDPGYGPIIQPIYQSSTYIQTGFEEHKGFDYSRSGNPNRNALEKCLASLEEATTCVAYASGVAAAEAIGSLLRPGQHLLAGDDLYGGTYRLFEDVLKPRGIEVTYARAEPEAFARSLRHDTAGVWLETPTNPLLRIVDLPAMAKVVRDRSPQAWLCVDNTFATPYLQRPLELGADLAMHSTTKYISGHSDLIGGAVVTSRDDLAERLQFHQNAVGSVPGPFDCWLALRGLRTLALRMEAHQRNAMAVAEFLQGHPKVERVIYPGLSDHPQHDLARRQMRGFGGIVSVAVRGGEEEARRFATHTRVFLLAVSLGATESLVCHPFSMTHLAMPAEEKLRVGITENLLRLSVGIEDPEDLVEDLDQALRAV